MVKKIKIRKDLKPRPKKEACPSDCPDSNFCLACPKFHPYESINKSWSYKDMGNNMEGVAK